MSSGDSVADGESELWQATAVRSATPAVEQDEWAICSKLLSDHMRDRPTLPASLEDPTVSLENVAVPIRLPLYSCPFSGCVFATDDRVNFLKHLADYDSPHLKLIQTLCGEHIGSAQHKAPLDFVYKAMAVKERNNIPLVGPATTRRALLTLKRVYNDEDIAAVVCFTCGQIKTTLKGPEHVVFGQHGPSSQVKQRCEVEFVSRAWFNSVEHSSPGTLLNNCSFELWKKR